MPDIDTRVCVYRVRKKKNQGDEEESQAARHIERIDSLFVSLRLISLTVLA